MFFLSKDKNVEFLSVFREYKDDIFERWQKELNENPRFSGTDILQNKNLTSTSKDFYTDLLKTVESSDIPDCSQKTFEPLLKFWHQTIKEQVQHGFTTKDTALLIFSLKASIISFIKDYYAKSGYMYTPELNKLGNLLDLLGVLTFEIYTAEKESLISRQLEQINYLQGHINFGDLIGNSLAMKGVYQAIGLVLENDITVLLEGESGTGKDLVANVIHNNSKRKNKPFITLNCGAIPKDLIESELFGHEKGAFTSAENRRLGKFELADGGTLFLDEIGDLSLDAQVKLLRAIQNREIERVGGSEKINIDVRIIAATNKSLKKEVDNGAFRMDLYYRVNVYPIMIPALRDRGEDIVPLANHFLDYYCEKFKYERSGLSKGAEKYLISKKWDGNVRELENLMQRAVVISQGNMITADVLDLQPGLMPIIADAKKETHLIGAVEGEFMDIIPLEEIEKKAIKHALGVTNGNIRKASKALGVSRTTFYNKLARYNIEV